MKFIKHLKTIFIHKYWVFYFGRKFGIGWQTFWHDLSKFSPSEFFESVKYYTGTRSPIDVAKELNGYSKAWMHHKGRNPHHYEYWQDNFDQGGIPIDPPAKYKIEMLCDYLAAAVTYSKKSCTFHQEHQWWINKKSKGVAMHQDTIKFFDEIFNFLDTYFGNELIHRLSSEAGFLVKNRIIEILKLR